MLNVGMNVCKELNYLETLSSLHQYIQIESEPAQECPGSICMSRWTNNIL